MRLIGLFLHDAAAPTAIATGSGVISGAVTTSLLAMINYLIKHGGFNGSAWLIGGFIGLCAIRLGAGVCSHLILIKLSQRIVRRLRLRLCGRMIGAPLADLERISTSRLLGAFTEDLAPLANAVINIPYMFVNAIVIGACLLYIGWMSWPMVGGVCICISIGAITYAVPVFWANRHLREGRKEQDKLFRGIRMLVDGIKELKLNQQKALAFRNELLEPATRAVERCNVYGIGVYSIAANWNRVLFFLYTGALLAITSSYGQSVQVLLVDTILVLLYIMAPVEAILNAVPTLAQAEIALCHVENLNLSLLAAEFPLTQSEPSLKGSWKRIQFKNITYTYDPAGLNQPFAVGPIDLELVRGKITFLTGGNGSGKTTLAKVICGLYKPESGCVSLDDQPVNEENRHEYRELVSATFADSCIFDSLLGVKVSERAAAQLRVYFRELGLDQFVQMKGTAFSTTVLSQGQRKRLALFSALAEDRPICVFDEWAADQDPQFRETFYTQVLPNLAREGKAIVVITHDDRYFEAGHELLKLDRGRLVHVRRASEFEGSVLNSKIPDFCDANVRSVFT